MTKLGDTTLCTGQSWSNMNEIVFDCVEKK